MVNPDSLDLEQAQRLPGVLLWHASKLWQQHLNAVLKELGLSSTNAVILCNALHLFLEHKRSTQAVIARLSGVDIMTTSTALRTLERKGYVSRKQGLDDRRSQEITLTGKGEQIALLALERIAETHQTFFGTLHDDERQQLVHILLRLTEGNKLT